MNDLPSLDFVGIVVDSSFKEIDTRMYMPAYGDKSNLSAPSDMNGKQNAMTISYMHSPPTISWKK